MKKTLFLLILITVSIQSFAQEFAPIGANWHYTQGTINPDITTFKTIESISDTIINGTQCKKMIEVERYYDTTSVSYHYMYSENDSVFFYADNSFHLLYDFGANAGDTVILDYYTTSNGSPLLMIIDSVSIIMINNQSKKIQYITCGDGIVIEFGQHVIEGIGSTSFMFPTLDASIDGPLRCYQDNNCGLFLSSFHPNYGWNFQDCEEIITGINELNSLEGMTVYPNPTKGFISVENIHQETEFKITDMNGKILLKGIVSESNEINIENLSKGIYFIEFKNENIMLVRKIVKE
jgi:hypothetical protein